MKYNILAVLLISASIFGLASCNKEVEEPIPGECHGEVFELKGINAKLALRENLKDVPLYEQLHLNKNEKYIICVEAITKTLCGGIDYSPLNKEKLTYTYDKEILKLEENLEINPENDFVKEFYFNVSFLKEEFDTTVKFTYDNKFSSEIVLKAQK